MDLGKTSGKVTITEQMPDAQATACVTKQFGGSAVLRHLAIGTHPVSSSWSVGQRAGNRVRRFRPASNERSLARLPFMIISPSSPQSAIRVPQSAIESSVFRN
jgi:hypothetical protein